MERKRKHITSSVEHSGSNVMARATCHKLTFKGMLKTEADGAPNDILIFKTINSSSGNSCIFSVV